MSDESEQGHHIMIGTIEKNARDTIVVQVRQFKEKYYIDIRNHYPDMAGELKPTQKGISLEVTRFKELQDLIAKVEPSLAQLPPLKGK